MATQSSPLIDGVHHINLLVRDLDMAMAQYRAQLGVESFIVDDLPGRGVRTARFRAGESWIVLVQPVAEGEPMRVLKERGEGLFLLSFGVSDLDEVTESVVRGGGRLTSTQPRQGLADWRVIDVDPADLSGSQIQLTHDPEQ
jgi:methylmalonyl-CoA/ethylmalonyl-CoA epimerase